MILVLDWGNRESTFERMRALKVSVMGKGPKVLGFVGQVAWGRGVQRFGPWIAGSEAE